ncbi:hypothetical protein LDENG_00195090 [Lucifuga dentata]|nr:hypothetical protein LDENG_00195090 [Lucifuga dentata]
MVRTDHSALQWLMTFKEPEEQVARWLEELQAFNFNVEHRAEARHTNADALSRCPCAADGCATTGVLQRVWKEPATGEERWQVVVPKDLQETVLKAMHGAGVWAFWCHEDTPLPPSRSHGAFPRTTPTVSSGGPHGKSGSRCGPATSLRQRPLRPLHHRLFHKMARGVCSPRPGGRDSRGCPGRGHVQPFGVPETTHSDQGRNFKSQVFASMCEACLGVHKTHITPMRPQSDGLVERFHRTLGQQLAILMSQHQWDWDKHLPLVLMACRSAVQETSSCTLALLMLGRELHTPAEMAFGQPPDSPVTPPGPEYARRLQDCLQLAHTFARDQQQNAGMRQKWNYDVKAQGRHFWVGELVWVFSPQRKKGQCPKLDSQWAGPCRVLERLGEVIYWVQLPSKGRKMVLHRDCLAPYRGGSSSQAAGIPVSPPQPSPSHPACSQHLP